MGIPLGATEMQRLQVDRTREAFADGRRLLAAELKPDPRNGGLSLSYLGLARVDEYAEERRKRR